jgi:hypothetical protein
MTTIEASAASKSSKRRALTQMRRVLPSHLPSGSKAGRELGGDLDIDAKCRLAAVAASRDGHVSILPDRSKRNS